MNHETRYMSTFGHRILVDTLMAPAYALATEIMRGLSVLRQKYEKHSAERKRDRAIAISIRELSRLDDRVLLDIGINRADIHAVAIAVAHDPNVNLREIVGR